MLHLFVSMYLITLSFSSFFSGNSKKTATVPSHQSSLVAPLGKLNSSASLSLPEKELENCSEVVRNSHDGSDRGSLESDMTEIKIKTARPV